jgi:hypothetical protein
MPALCVGGKMQNSKTTQLGAPMHQQPKNTMLAPLTNMTRGQGQIYCIMHPGTKLLTHTLGRQA